MDQCHANSANKQRCLLVSARPGTSARVKEIIEALPVDNIVKLSVEIMLLKSA